MIKYFPLVLILVLAIQLTAMGQNRVDIEGHRGARGLMPENTIPAFITALDLGVTTLEMDVVITADGDVVLSHEPYFNHDICLDPEGNKIKASDEKDHNIYKMTTEEVKSYDCGSIGNPNFSEQKKMKVSKPLLSEVIQAVESHIKDNNGYKVDYNIELKSEEKTDGEFHPTPEEFSSIVYEVIDSNLSWDRVIIQCFDFRVLKYWNENYPDVRLAALVANLKSPEKNIEELSFIPDIYSPYFKMLDKKKIDWLHEQSILVIPWTVNDPKDMKKMIEWGVDGIITDYPDRSAELGYNLNTSSGK